MSRLCRSLFCACVRVGVSSLKSTLRNRIRNRSESGSSLAFLGGRPPSCPTTTRVNIGTPRNCSPYQGMSTHPARKEISKVIAEMPPVWWRPDRKPCRWHQSFLPAGVEKKVPRDTQLGQYRQKKDTVRSGGTLQQTPASLNPASWDCGIILALGSSPIGLVGSLDPRELTAQHFGFSTGNRLRTGAERIVLHCPVPLINHHCARDSRTDSCASVVAADDAGQCSFCRSGDHAVQCDAMQCRMVSRVSMLAVVPAYIQGDEMLHLALRYSNGLWGDFGRRPPIPLHAAL